MSRPWLTGPNLLRSQGLTTCETACRLVLSLHMGKLASERLSSSKLFSPQTIRQPNTRTLITIRHHFGRQVRNQVDGVWKRETQGVKHQRQRLVIVSTRYWRIFPRCQTWEEATNYTSTQFETIEEDNFLIATDTDVKTNCDVRYSVKNQDYGECERVVLIVILIESPI